MINQFIRACFVDNSQKCIFLLSNNNNNHHIIIQYYIVKGKLYEIFFLFCFEQVHHHWIYIDVLDFYAQKQTCTDSN